MSGSGPGVTEVAVGDRVGMPWLGYACGSCEYCGSGRETLCLAQKNMGYSFDGRFGEYAAAYESIADVESGRIAARIVTWWPTPGGAACKLAQTMLIC